MTTDYRAALEQFANAMGKMMRDYELPEECNGIIAGELDTANDLLEKWEGTEGQDRESYSDTQDRENYTA